MEFGNKLETIGGGAFWGCISLRQLNFPSIRTVEQDAFYGCTSLVDVEFGEELETIEYYAFDNCSSLRRIAIPLNDNMLTFSYEHERNSQFDGCGKLTTEQLTSLGRSTKPFPI